MSKLEIMRCYHWNSGLVQFANALLLFTVMLLFSQNGGAATVSLFSGQIFQNDSSLNISPNGPNRASYSALLSYDAADARELILNSENGLWDGFVDLTLVVDDPVGGRFVWEMTQGALDFFIESDGFSTLTFFDRTGTISGPEPAGLSLREIKLTLVDRAMPTPYFTQPHIPTEVDFLALLNPGAFGSISIEFIGPSIRQDIVGAHFSVEAVPLPAGVWLFGTALIGLIGFGKCGEAI